MVCALWNLACGGHRGLNMCVTFQSAMYGETITTKAMNVNINRPAVLRLIVFSPLDVYGLGRERENCASVVAGLPKSAQVASAANGSDVVFNASEMCRT